MQTYPALIDHLNTPTNQPHLYRALLHQDSITFENADVPSANETPPPPPSVQSPTTPGQYGIAEC